MKTLKRSLSLVLILTVLLTTFSATAQAVDIHFTDRDYGCMVLTNNKYNKVLSTVKLYGSHDYLNFYMKPKWEGMYFFYEIYSDKNYTKLVYSDYVYTSHEGGQTKSHLIKLKGTFSSKTYYCITYAALEESGGITIFQPSIKKFKIVVDRTSDFAKQVVVLKNTKNTINGPQISWYKHSNAATKYYVYRRPYSGSTWTKIATVGASTLSYVDKSVKDKAGKFVYTVKAINKKGQASRYQYGGSLAIYCVAPTLTAATASNNRVKLEWKGTPSCSHYIIYRREVGKNWVILKESLHAPYTTNSYYDKTAVSGKTYEYTIRGYINTYQGKGTSAYRTGTILKYVGSPVITSVAPYEGNLKIDWNEAVGASSYTVYRKPLDSKENWTKLANVDNKTFSYTDLTATEADGFKYTVRAESDGCRGSYSTTGYDYAKLLSPQVTYGYNDNGTMYLNWEKIPFTEQIYVKVKDENGEWTNYRHYYLNPPTSVAITRYGENTFAVQVARTVNGKEITSNINDSIVTIWVSPNINLSIRGFTDYTELSWNNFSADNYNIYRKEISADEFQLIGATETTSFKDESALADVSYDYCVKAVYDGVEQSENITSKTFCKASLPKEVDVKYHIESRQTHYNDDYMEAIWFDGYENGDRIYMKSDNGSFRSIGNEFSLWGKSYGTKYTFYFTFNVNGNETPIDAYPVEYTYTAPSKVPQYTTKNTETKYTITWNHIDDAVKYKLSYGEYGRYTVEIVPDGSSSYSYSIDNSILNKETFQREFTLTVYHENGDIYEHFLADNYMTTPTVRYASRSDNCVYLGWDDTNYDVKYFRVYRKTTGDWEKLADVKVTEEDYFEHLKNYYYTDKTAKNGVAYTYTVRAVKYNGVTSGFSSKGKTCKATA